MYKKQSFSVVHRKHGGTGLAELTLYATSRKGLLDAREHLRYWPFVKEFREITPLGFPHALRVTIFIGRGLTHKQWLNYCRRGQELMTLCVKQHKAFFCGWSDELLHFAPHYTDSEYLRPDDLLQPMSNFINE